MKNTQQLNTSSPKAALKTLETSQQNLYYVNPKTNNLYRTSFRLFLNVLTIDFDFLEFFSCLDVVAHLVLTAVFTPAKDTTLCNAALQNFQINYYELKRQSISYIY